MHELVFFFWRVHVYEARGFTHNNGTIATVKALFICVLPMVLERGTASSHVILSCRCMSSSLVPLAMVLVFSLEGICGGNARVELGDARRDDDACCASAQSCRLELQCEDRRHEVPEFAFNPLDPLHTVQTHPTFRKFQVQSRAFEPGFIFEAFGVRVDYRYDCSVMHPDLYGKPEVLQYDALAYRKVVPSRSLACLQHEARLKLPPQDRPTCIQGFFPAVDDEYIEYADALQSVLEHDMDLPYVVVELGARYGTWAVRCVKALQQLNATAHYVAYLAESEDESAEHCRAHCRNNDVECLVALGYVGAVTREGERERETERERK